MEIFLEFFRGRGKIWVEDIGRGACDEAFSKRSSVPNLAHSLLIWLICFIFNKFFWSTLAQFFYFCKSSLISILSLITMVLKLNGREGKYSLKISQLWFFPSNVWPLINLSSENFSKSLRFGLADFSDGGGKSWNSWLKSSFWWKRKPSLYEKKGSFPNNPTLVLRLVDFFMILMLRNFKIPNFRFLTNFCLIWPQCLSSRILAARMWVDNV